MIKKKISDEKHAVQARFSMKQNAPQARLINQKCSRAAGRIL